MNGNRANITARVDQSPGFAVSRAGLFAGNRRLHEQVLRRFRCNERVWSTALDRQT
jgi:hypothetical protein